MTYIVGCAFLYLSLTGLNLLLVGLFTLYLTGKKVLQDGSID